MGIQDDKPIPYKTFAAIKSQLVTELQLTPLEWLKLLGPNLDSTGNPQNLLNTSGYVTEASAATISTNAAGAVNALRMTHPLMGTRPNFTDQTGCEAREHLVYTVPITIAAGGAVTNVALHATLAGYKFHFKVLGIEMDTTDATTTWWFHTTAGGVSCVGCPASPGFSPVALTAATINTQLSGCYMNNGAATGDVTLLDVAGVGAGAANGFIYIEGWFETT